MLYWHIVHYKPIECGICLDQYKDPKLLSCFHVFCKECLERLVLQEEGQSILRCPNCRRGTAVPAQGVSGLQSDFHAHHLFEIRDTLTKAKEPQKTQCEKCKKSTATGFCRDCGKFICDKCTEMHQMWDDLATDLANWTNSLSTSSKAWQHRETRWNSCTPNSPAVWSTWRAA